MSSPNVVPLHAGVNGGPGAPRQHAQGLAYVERGQGAAVVLIHGALMTLDDMALSLLEPLGREFRTVAFDRPGHGMSPRARLFEASPWSQARAIRDACAALGIDRAIVVGHSMGGAVALAHAMAYPANTRGVVALAPIVAPEPRLEQMLFGPFATLTAGDVSAAALAGPLEALLLPLLWRSMFLPQPMPRYFQTEFPFHLAGRHDALVSTGEDALATPAALALSMATYPICAVPVRVIAGTHDLVVNNYLHGARLPRMMPDAHVNWLDGLGHMIHHFAADAIVAGIRDLDGATRHKKPPGVRIELGQRSVQATAAAWHQADLGPFAH